MEELRDITTVARKSQGDRALPRPPLGEEYPRRRHPGEKKFES
jgi:hypothetical protein